MTKYERYTSKDGATLTMSQWGGSPAELELYRKLAELEDKIENGTLIELPCKVGTTIYHLYKASNVITEDKVFNYHFEICSKPCVSFENHFWYGTEKRVDTILVEHFGKYWFTDKAEAQAKLRELKGERE